MTVKISNSLARYPIYGLTLYGLTIGWPECYFDSYQSLALSIRHLEVDVKKLYNYIARAAGHRAAGPWGREL